jgi:hypothetical protein
MMRAVEIPAAMIPEAITVAVAKAAVPAAVVVVAMVLVLAAVGLDRAQGRGHRFLEVAAGRVAGLALDRVAVRARVRAAAGILRCRTFLHGLEWKSLTHSQIVQRGRLTLAGITQSRKWI